jgi:hypothetical protein
MRDAPSLLVSTEAQGHRRRWEQKATERFDRLVKLCASGEICRMASDFAAKSGKGRERAHAKLRQVFNPFGVVESELITGPVPRLYYSAVGAPVPDLFTSPEGDPEPLKGTQRTGVPVHFVALGRLAGKVVARGTWACSLTGLALDTWFMRAKDPDALDAAVLNAHRTLLAAPQRNAPLLLSHDVLLPVGDGQAGFFWSTPIAARREAGKDALFHVRLRAFLPWEMAPNETIEQSAGLLQIAPGDEPMVSGPLHPLFLLTPPA